VRELRNAMERAGLLSRGELILPEHLPARVRSNTTSTQGDAPAGSLASARSQIADAQRLEEIERQAVVVALQKNHYNRTETAKALGISRRALIYKLQRLREQGFQVDPE
jgi:two-component system response regulator AtoC